METPGNNLDSSVENRLEESVMKRARLLVEKYSLDKPNENVTSALDLVTVLRGEQDFDEIKRLIEGGGFDGVNICLDQIPNDEELEKVKSKLEEHNIKITSFHGSLDHFFVGFGEKPDPAIIVRDFEMAKQLDPGQDIPINYDLVSADMRILGLFQSGETSSVIEETQEKTLNRLGLGSDEELIDRTIEFVGKSKPKDSKRVVVFETRQTALARSPKITDENLKRIVDKAGEFFGDNEWGVTIDLGHSVANLPDEWSVNNAVIANEEARKISDLLEKYEKYIRMIHVCGDSMSHSVASRLLAKRNDVDLDVVKKLGKHGVIDNKIILDLLAKFRSVKTGKFVEVSEIVPQHFMKRYFGDLLKFDEKKSLENYKEQVELQAKMLGYGR
ncbi:MAG TPA: hypothetical protein PKA60_02915 [Candidatus Paceibacterota bacterium]|nr:hypothetical protein [Candidatus Paceibacterota bacterium]